MIGVKKNKEDALAGFGWGGFCFGLGWVSFGWCGCLGLFCWFCCGFFFLHQGKDNNTFVGGKTFSQI